MTVMTANRISEAIRRAPHVRATQSTHSTKTSTAKPLTSVESGAPIRMGDRLAALGRKLALSDADLAIFEKIRDQKPARPFVF